MTKLEKLLFFSRDPGGTNQLVALRDILLGKPCEKRNFLFEKLELSSPPEIILMAKEYAQDIWRKNGVLAEAWPEKNSLKAVKSLLSSVNPAQIFTSTSHLDDRTEQMVWQIAKQLAIKTTSFLDSSHNIILRFTNDQGKIILPDQVAVIDEEAAHSLISLGLKPQNILRLGDLYQSYIKHRAGGQGQVNLRKKWCSEKGESLILFASDYINEMQALGVEFEVTEFECLDLLLEKLRTGGISEYLAGIRLPSRLIIRPHPKDTKGKYDKYLLRNSHNLTIVINDEGSSTDAILSSDAVASAGSSLLTEARTLGVKEWEIAPTILSCRNQ